MDFKEIDRFSIMNVRVEDLSIFPHTRIQGFHATPIGFVEIRGLLPGNIHNTWYLSDSLSLKWKKPCQLDNAKK